MSVCPLHGRPSSTTCVRCGVFLCDWCEKLAPSWGPGLCADCQRRSPPARRFVAPSRPVMVVSMLLLWVGTASLFAVFDDFLAWESRAVRAVIAVFAFGAIGFIVHSHRRAPTSRRRP
ncbi:MAG: hypothetical protein ACOZQL_36280 [Myxococcota bacterium]